MSETTAEKTETQADLTKKPDPPKATGRVGLFIQKYSNFISSIVLGVAGLIATSIWQYRQSEIARRSADSQLKIAETKAANDWRITRAEILSKNLEVLATNGSNNVEQRYGVLLSLTRGDILDPELAVSYALDLGRDNPDYMRTVLSNTTDKSYVRLAGAFELTCMQRFGVSRDVRLCKGDKTSERSQAIADVISDELHAAMAQGRPGPLILLKEEREVQASPMRMAALFQSFLDEIYERRQWDQLKKFEDSSPSAKLVAALVLAAEKPSEFISDAEKAQVEKFHDERSKWLSDYLIGKSCNADCRGRLVDVILTSYAEAEGRFDAVMRMLLRRPRAEVGPVLARLHQRLLACQVDAADINALRDRVLVSVLTEDAANPKPDPAVLEDEAGLLALVPEPKDPQAKANYTAALEKLRTVDDKLKPPAPNAPPAEIAAHKALKDIYGKAFVRRRNSAQAARRSPPPALKHAMFCNAAELEEEVELEE